MLDATAMGVTSVATPGLGHGAQQTRPVTVTLVIDQGPGPVQRRRTDIIRVPGDDVAS